MKRLACHQLLTLSLTLGACSAACSIASATPAATTASSAAPRPATAAALFEHGMQAARTGDAVRAEQYLVLAVRAGFPEPRAIVPLVQLCIASSRLRAALSHAEPFLRRHPDTWQLRYLTAAIYLALERPAEAVAELRRVLAQRRDSAQAHYLLGVTLRDAFRDASAARGHFEAYLLSAPEGVHAAEVTAWLSEQRDTAQTSALKAAEAP